MVHSERIVDLLDLRRKTRRNDLARKCFRNFIILFHVFVAVLSTIGMVAGPWLVGGHLRGLEGSVGSNGYAAAVYAGVTCCAVTLVLVMTVGCFAVIFRFKWLLVVHSVLLLILAATSFAAAGTAYIQRSLQSDAELRLHLLNSVVNAYGHPTQAELSTSIDYLQEEYFCCGVTVGNASASPSVPPYRIWQRSQWFRNQNYFPKDRLPMSCCAKCRNLYHRHCLTTEPKSANCKAYSAMCSGPNGEVASAEMCRNPAAIVPRSWTPDAYINTQDCYPKLQHILHQLSTVIGIFCALHGGVLLIGVCATMALYRLTDSPAITYRYRT